MKRTHEHDSGKASSDTTYFGIHCILENVLFSLDRIDFLFIIIRCLLPDDKDAPIVLWTEMIVQVAVVVRFDTVWYVFVVRFVVCERMK